MLKRLLIITGVLALVALASPTLVTLGLFLGILPGLILGFAPVVFCYLAATAVLRRLLPLPNRLATAVAFAAAIALGWLATLPDQAAGQASFDRARLGEIAPAAPVRIHGAVRLERTLGAGNRRKEVPVCDALCAALLKTASVTSVTLVATGGNAPAPVRYRLAAKGSIPDTGLAPVKPGDLLPVLEKPGGPNGTRPRTFAALQAAQAAIEADWTLRLATRETLVADNNAEQADITISITSERAPAHAQSIERLELQDRAGTVLARRELLKFQVLAAPLRLDFAGSVESARFELGRKTLSNRARYASFDPVPELFEVAAIAVPSAPADAPHAMRERLAAALAVPGGPTDLVLAPAWMRALGYRTPTGDDAELVAKIVEDMRIRDVEALKDIYPKQVPVRLRAGLAARILDPATAPTDRSRLANMLARMPQGSFAEPTAAEHAIWNRPELQDDVAAFYERIADQGAAGLPLLMQTLDRALAIGSWAKRRPIIRSVRRGLARLGPDARSALPRIQSLFAMRPSPIMNVSQEAELWRMTMVRMGLPPDELVFPDHSRPEMQERDRATIVRMVERYDPQAVDGYSY